jgi:truncated hemoglobin YjbI
MSDRERPQHDGRVLLVADHGLKDAEHLAPPEVNAVVDDFYTAIGGRDFFERLAARFYLLVSGDDLLAALFPNPDWDLQTRRLADHYISLYGDNDLTAAWDPRLHQAHTFFVITREHRTRWLELMRRAGHELGAPEPQFGEFMTIMKIASGEMMAVSRGAGLARGKRFHWDGSPR